MSTTPEEPTGPDEPETSGAPSTPPTTPPDEPSPPAGPPPGPAGPLPPVAEEPRRLLTGGRLAVIGAVAVATLVAGLGVVLAGDDGGSDPVASIDDDAADTDSSGGDDGSTEAVDMEDAVLEYAQCMRDHGVDMPDPQVSEDGQGVMISRDDGGGPGLSPGPGDEDFEAAQAECGHIMEDARGDIPAPSPEEMAEMQDRLVAMAECMRERGHDLPDPQVSSDGGVSIQVGSDSGPIADGEQFEKDQQECNEEAGLGDGPGMRIGAGGAGE